MKRRLFLKGVGGASLAAPFLPSLMAPRTARAASNGPQRLVIFYTNNGCLTNRRCPKTASGPVLRVSPEQHDVAPRVGGDRERIDSEIKRELAFNTASGLNSSAASLPRVGLSSLVDVA